MSNPFFSVIVPTYNRAHLISETIESVLAQTFKDFELIIVDDGSTDNTKEVIHKYLSDPRVKYIYQENKERAAARNNGIRNSTGEWIALLDSDDLWLPNHLESCFNTIKQIKSPALVYSYSYLADDKGNIISKLKTKSFEGYILEKIVKQGHSGFTNSSSSIHKAILNDVGLFNEDRTLSGSEDTELWIRIASKYPFYSTGIYTVKLRRHVGQTMINPEHMEKCGNRMYEIIFSNPDLKIGHLKSIAKANKYVLYAINYYASGKMKDARERLYKAINEDKKILLNRMWWWVWLRTFIPKQITFCFRNIKYNILKFFSRYKNTNNNQQPLGVCMIVAKYPPYLGGLERQAHLLSKTLTQKGIEVFVLTRNYTNLKKDELVDGVNIHRVSLLGTSVWLASLSYIIGSLYWLLKNKRKYNIIHCHQSYSPMSIGIIAKLFLNKPVIVKLTNSMILSEFSELKRLPLYKVRKFFLRKVDKFIALIPTIKEEAKRHDIPNERILIIPNGVNIKQKSSYFLNDKLSARSIIGLKKNNVKIVVFTGRLSREKGLDTLIKAWSLISRTIESKLFIVGEDDLSRNIANEIKVLVAQFDLEDSVIFTGRVEDTTDYLIASDIFVLPSIAEGMSNSLLEAMAAGCAIIASDIAPNKELIIDNFNGLLFKVGNELALSEKLIALLSNQLLCEKLGKTAKQTAIERYSIDKVADKYIQLYHELI